MLLKRKDVGGGREGFRSQDSGFRSLEKHFENAPSGPAKVPNCFAPLDSMSVGKGERKNLVTLKMQEQRGNVYENKGSALHSPRQSGNIIENTGSYEFKAGMLLKRKAGFRSQQSAFRSY
jgi:hypothetical protein